MELKRWRKSRPTAQAMRSEVFLQSKEVKGFLSDAEGAKLFELAQAVSRNGPCVEIGSYCGKSALFLGEGCRSAGVHSLFSIDHHRGSEEQQPGQEYFDAGLYDSSAGRVDTLSHFLRNLDRAGLLGWVIPIVGESSQVAKNWPSVRLSLVFIDGGHSEAVVNSDYECWERYIMRGGYLCFHDIYANPSDGGQAPFRVFTRAQTLSKWRFIGVFGSMGVLRRR